jgi:hypothetical protein
MDCFTANPSLTNAVKIIKDHDWTLPTPLAGDSKKQLRQNWQTTPSLSPRKKRGKNATKRTMCGMWTLVERTTTHHLTMTHHPMTSVPVAFSYSP